MRTYRWVAVLVLGCLLVCSAKAAEKIRVACVGDSITFGYGLRNAAQESYPAALQKLLGSAYQVGNFGVNGAAVQRAAGKPYWTLPKMKDAEAFAPQIVVVMLGSNDANLKNWNAAAFAKDYGEFLAHWKALPGKPTVYAALPVPAYGQAFSIQPAVVEKELPPLLKQAAEAAHVPVINTFEALSGKPELFPDKIHPNAQGAQLIADTVAKALQAAAQAQDPLQGIDK
ncbi:MAG: hypothetical protein HS116_28600 [Planctomycetes bacterium]|nr:hypothetical protein [Planctomycetota bacterium]